MWWKYLDFIKTTELTALWMKKYILWGKTQPCEQRIESRMENVMHHCAGLCSCHAMLALSNNYFFSSLYQQRLKMTIHIIYLPPTNVPKMKSRNSIKNLSKKFPFSLLYCSISSSLQLQKFPSLKASSFCIHLMVWQ